MNERIARLNHLLTLLAPVPEEWGAVARRVNGHAVEVAPEPCTRWSLLEAAWADALRWRRVMGDVLSVMLAVAGSTQQAGNQLFLQVIGDAGSGKTQMCDGLIVSKHCHALEHLTGFHSGYKLPGNEDKDCSLIARINGKTLVTPEGDVLMSSPKFTEIMSQQRRIFDGTSGATYKNTDEDRRYVSLRTPWIMAGTPALMDTDQSRLGDRFIRVMIDQPTDDERRHILRHAFRTEITAMVETADGTAGSTLDPKMRRAQALTGGYVDHLRVNSSELLSRVDLPLKAEDRCLDLAELTADLRARPNTDAKKTETHDTKELPTRIARQLGRMAKCLAMVLNKHLVDDDVMRRVRKVALDTAHGKSLDIVRWLMSVNSRSGQPWQRSGGVAVGTLARWLGMTDEKMSAYLNFLRKIRVVEHREIASTLGFWKLTDRVEHLFANIHT